MERTEQQKQIDSWIVENVDTDALDKNIKINLTHCPMFKKYNRNDVLNAIETVYLEITPEEQYDIHIWTVIIERALEELEPNKNKLFKIELNNYDNYVKEIIVGYKWLACNLDTDTEKDCLRLDMYHWIKRCITIEGDEEDCTITRIK